MIESLDQDEGLLAMRVELTVKYGATSLNQNYANSEDELPAR